ncbi:MAG: hypothetical protein WCB49_12405 [Gammaproteobacteria bacterium]
MRDGHHAPPTRFLFRARGGVFRNARHGRPYQRTHRSGGQRYVSTTARVPRNRKIPVSPGQLTLYYPKYVHGEHDPIGPEGNVTAFKLEAHGKTVA